jgi:hypothetical protein
LDGNFLSAIKAMLPTSAPVAIITKMNFTVVKVMADPVSVAGFVNFVGNNARSSRICNIPKRLRSWSL